MEALAKLIPLLITVSLAGLVLAVGLHSQKGDLLYVFRRPPLLLRAILAVLVIPPVLAGLLVAWLPIDPAVKAGIMVMAVSPVPPLVPGKELGVGGRREYAYGLYAAMALLTIISTPLVLTVASHLFGRTAHVSVVQLGQTVLLGVLVPLAIGVAVQRAAPAFADRAWSVVYKLAMALVLVAFLPIMVKAWGAIFDLVGNGTLLVMAVVSLATLAVGHLLGGPDLPDRAALAMAASVRHPGIAMSLAAAAAADTRVTAAVLLFMLVGMVVAIPYTVWVKRRGRSAPTAA